MSDAFPGDADAPGRGPIRVFAGHPVAANLLMALLLAGGVFGAMNLSLRNFPDPESRQIRVTVPYPGASPVEIEQEINRRLEVRLLAVKGVRGVASQASGGVGVVTVDIDLFADAGEVLADARAAVESIESLPPLAEQPKIAALRPDIRVMTLAVSSPLLSGDALRRAADRVREELLALPAVSLVETFAAPEREIAIEADEEALRRHDMTLRDLAAAVASASVEISSGELRTAAGSFVLITRARRALGAEFEDIVLRAQEDGTVLRVADVARVTDGFADTPTLTEVDGQRTVFLAIDRAPEEEPLDIAAAVRELLADYVPPAGVDVEIWDDHSARIGRSLGELLANVFLGFVLVVVFLSLVFDLRVAAWVAIGVPVAFLGACLLFPAFDVVISATSLFALFLVIGIVVDDAVVVGESIASEHERGGSAVANAVAGARAVRGPVVVGVLTTMVAFLPLLFTYGPIGQFLQVIPVVVVLVLAVSLVEAFFILPAHLSRSAAWSRAPLSGIQRRNRARLDRFRDRLVVPAITQAVRRPAATLAVGAAALVVAALLLATGVVKFNFIQHPPETGRVKADIVFPVGTPFAVTRQAAYQAAEAAERVDAAAHGVSIRSVAVIVGTRFDLFAHRLDDAPLATHLASVVAHLDDDAGAEELDAIERLWRQETGPVRGAESVEFGWVWEAYSGEVGYGLTHLDEAVLTKALDELGLRLAQMPAITHIEHSLGAGKQEYEIELTPVGTAAGLDPLRMATQLRERFFGIEAQRIQRGRDEVVVAVRYPRERRRSLGDLLDERMARAAGAEVPLTAVARFEETRDRASRMRIDGVPAGIVVGRVDDAVASPFEVRQRFAPVLEELTARHPGLRVVPVGDAKYREELLASAAFTMPLALAIVYILIAVLFRSYLMPLVTLAAIPVAAAGAVFGHLILGYDFTLVSLFGIVAAGGVVVNDTLVLLDRYRTIRAAGDRDAAPPTGEIARSAGRPQGGRVPSGEIAQSAISGRPQSGRVPAVAAASAATRQRFRAIFLTTATTMVGLLPMLYFSESLFFVPLVISLMFGLAASSVGILFVVPAVLLLAETFRERRE